MGSERDRGQSQAICWVSAPGNFFILQAGSQFTSTFTGTTRISRKNVVKDDVVFVAGAGGRVGSRIVQECAKAGYTVRAGVRTREKGQDLLQGFKDNDVLTPQQLRKIRIEDYDLFEPDTIAPAIGNAGARTPSTLSLPLLSVLGHPNHIEQLIHPLCSSSFACNGVCVGKLISAGLVPACHKLSNTL